MSLQKEEIWTHRKRETLGVHACEDTERRQQSRSQGEGPQEKPDRDLGCLVSRTMKMSISVVELCNLGYCVMAGKLTKANRGCNTQSLCPFLLFQWHPLWTQTGSSKRHHSQLPECSTPGGYFWANSNSQDFWQIHLPQKVRQTQREGEVVKATFVRRSSLWWFLI